MGEMGDSVWERLVGWFRRWCAASENHGFVNVAQTNWVRLDVHGFDGLGDDHFEGERRR